RKISAFELLVADGINEQIVKNKLGIIDIYYIYGDDIFPFQSRVAFEEGVFNNQLDLLIGNVDHESYQFSTELNANLKMKLDNNDFLINKIEAEEYINNILEYYG